MANNQTYKKYREEGRCTRCGSTERAEGCLTCDACRIKNVEKRRMEQKVQGTGVYNKYLRGRYLKLKEAGICTHCAKSPTLDGHILCPYCQEKRKRQLLAKKMKPYLINVITDYEEEVLSFDQLVEDIINWVTEPSTR